MQINKQFRNRLAIGSVLLLLLLAPVLVAQQAPANKKPAKPVGTFTPTDKIDADSAVSFPVDI